MKKILRLSLLVSLLVVLVCLLVGCAGKSVYVSPGSTTQMDDKFSDTDLQMMATAMYNSILNSMSQFADPDEERKIIALLPVKNKTSEHINTEDIADKLQIHLLKAGTMRFVDRSKLQAITEQFDLSGSGLMDPNTVKSAGKVLGADYFMAGNLSSIEKRDRRKSQTFYRLSMLMIDAETDEIVWADEFEVKKQSSKNFLDW